MRYKYEPCPRCIKNGKDSRGDNLVVYSSGHGHCFACSYHRFPNHYTPQLKVDNAPKSLRPSDFTQEIPTRAWQWVLQYGLPYTYWQENCGYSAEKGERFVFQVRYEQQLAFSIGRLLSEGKDGGSTLRAPDRGDNPIHGITPGERGKPETTKPRKWYVWGDSHRHCEVVGGQHDSKSIVLVEDIVSAHKVGQVNEAIPLFGTQLHPCHLYYLSNANKPVVLWLDKDQELNVKKQALRLESLINNTVKIVVTDKDPKSLSFEDIKELI